MEQKKVVILDYQLGNLFSVKQACDNVGMNALISSDKEEIINADGIILPGVGAFKEAMNNLNALDIIAPLKDFVDAGKPLFGICLGLQLLFTESEEFGSKGGLNFIDGFIKKFTSAETLAQGAKVPQIGWNKIIAAKSFNNTPLADVADNEFMYFVHSYYVDASDNKAILTRTNYENVNYCSSVDYENIFASQFHPEKSGLTGISIYKNWAKQHNLI